MPSKLRIAHVVEKDAMDAAYLSGASRFMVSALREAGIEVEIVHHLSDVLSPWWGAKKVWYRKVRRQGYQAEREPLRARLHAKEVARRVSAIKPDLILAPSTLPIAYLDTNLPVIVWTDAPFGALMGFYPNFSGFCARTIEGGYALEKLAHERASLCVYPSTWASDHAVAEHQAQRSKLRVIPWGANLSHVPTREAVGTFIMKRSTRTCRLFFVQTDWLRKGGDKAVAIGESLQRLGLTVELTIIGALPPRDLPPFTHYAGYVDKTSAEGSAFFHRHLSQSHFLLLPTLADVVPHIIAEAAAYGLPTLATRVGGIPGMIADGETGFIFDPFERAEVCAEAIHAVLADRSRYELMAVSARDAYESRMSWPRSAREMADLMRSLVDG